MPVAEKRGDAGGRGGGHNGKASGGGFKQGIGKAFRARREHEERCVAELQDGVWNMACEADALVDAEGLCLLLKREELGAGASNDEF